MLHEKEITRLYWVNFIIFFNNIGLKLWSLKTYTNLFLSIHIFFSTNHFFNSTFSKKKLKNWDLEYRGYLNAGYYNYVSGYMYPRTL